MLSLLKGRLRQHHQPVVLVRASASNGNDDTRRNKQKNFKVSADCKLAIAGIAAAQGISEAALLEDMVAERLDVLQAKGIRVAIGKG